MTYKSRRLPLLASAILVASPLLARAAQPGQAAPDAATPAPRAPQPASSRAAPAAPAESLIVTGSRSGRKKARDSVSPIDVVSAVQLRRTDQVNLRDALVRLLPSITRQTYGGDTGSLTDAIRLRGLNPNEVLVLINGKRRHTTANIYADSGPQQGATPVDLDMIPASMIDHIEVLRDGAAAQYGSDAIAGVVNVILKGGATGGSAQALFGQTYAGDGFSTSVSGDKGAALGDDGFIRIGAEFVHSDHTDRTGTDLRTGTGVNQILGNPEQTRETFGINAEKDVGPDVTLYGNLTYGHRHAEALEQYRLPSSYPVVYPDGYEPAETIEENDYGVTIGARGDDLLSFAWDLSTTWGADQDNIGVKNSANTSIADTLLAPTNFAVASYADAQWTNNLDLKRPLAIPFMALPANLALGAEHRYEEYSLGAGEPDSYSGTGAQGLPGLLPALAGTWSRDVYAAYAELDLHPLRHLEIDVAGRYEYYTDAKDVETGKLSARYDITPHYALRATVSNGFQAPTLAEQHFSNLNVSPTAASGILGVATPGARALGSQPLKPERSTNVSAGLVAEPVHNLHIAADVYQINIRDRIVAGGVYNGATAINAIQSTGITLPGGINPTSVSAYYFSNGASTRTQGLDISADYLSRLGDWNGIDWGRIDWTLGLDLNRSVLHHVADDLNGRSLLNAQTATSLTRGSPRSKIILGATWTEGRFDTTLRVTRYGQTTDDLTIYTGATRSSALSNTIFYEFNNSPRWISDLELGYRLTHAWHLAVGANNLFDIYPRMKPAATNYLGTLPYDINAAQIGIDGGFYYARLNYTF
ncbi:TonB-dependent receptor plug domain-containing protein [Lichenicoccus roseus]|uniref:TonB-dependent receptor n=1 Tax=Lichenicoccus roseus TaxID=2683649 RepID=A0A5R9JC76_9PROT|nr:TonB-dependent receptor [Lichenicoccus roseus]TLU74137.1 TonB-dependent receptor [Lichenicoccus roseus]